MFSASCILFCIAGAFSADIFTYNKPWNTYRRSETCEMCYNGNCLTAGDTRCEYYADASKVIHDDDAEGDTNQIKNNEIGDKIDDMLFELVDTASSTSMYKTCVPFISQYTDCTKENTCLGCKFCTCTDEGRWTCQQKLQCRPGPHLNIDHRKINIAIQSLKRRGKQIIGRNKRSPADVGSKITDKLTFEDLSTWLYSEKPLDPKENTTSAEDIVKYLSDSKTSYYDGSQNVEERKTENAFLSYVNNDLSFTTNGAVNKNASDIDLIEFKDIIKTWSTEFIPEKNMDIIDGFQLSNKRDYKDLKYTEYDPINLVKRDASKLETNQSQAILQINSKNNVTYKQIITDALYGLNKITSEKQSELNELLSIRNNLILIAKAHNVTTNINSTLSHNEYTKHHIAIYKLDTFEKCMTKLKHDLYNALLNIIKTESLNKSIHFSKDLEILLRMFKKYIVRENIVSDTINVGTTPPQEDINNMRRHVEPDHNYVIFNPITYLSNIFIEINNTANNKNTMPLATLSSRVRKILKRVIRQLYLENVDIIDLIVYETYNALNKYLQNIGIKWDKMIQDVANSKPSDKLHIIKLLHMTLHVDIGKIEDVLSLLEFARNRRMTVANGAEMEISVSKIQNNLKQIDYKVQEIIRTQKIKRMRQEEEYKKPVKTISMMQKLKKMFQNSRDDIKKMLRKSFPKSEIIKRITKKKMDELEKERMLEYQETINKWQDTSKSTRKKRFAWGFHSFMDRIKSIIPGYLKGKVKKGIDSKKSGNKTRSHKTRGHRKENPTKAKTLKTTTASQRSNST